MKMKLSLFFLFLTFQALGSECFVVSGLKKDHNNFLGNRNLFKSEFSKVAGKQCTVVGSWKELDKVLITKKLPKGADVLIVQGAHGNEDANRKITFSCDAGTATSGEVLNYLNKFSANYQVGAVIHSCYSGDLMRDKLLQDEANPKNLDKLCLYTSSSMGRVTWGTEGDIIAKLESAISGETLEKLFLKVRAGMISSAAWSEIGLPEYFSKKTNEMGYKTLQALDGITRGELSCATDLGAANAALCAAPGITDAIYEDLSTFQDPLLSDSDKIQGVVYFERQSKAAKEALLKSPTSKLAKAQSDCYQFIQKTYKDNFGSKLENLETWDVIEKSVPIIKKMPGYASCETFTKLLPKERAEEGKNLIEGPYTDQVNMFRYKVDLLQKRYSKRKMDDSFNIKEFAKSAIGEKSVCNPDNKQQIIQSMFGDSFFLNETSMTSGPDEMINDRNVSTQLALKSFQNASMMKKEMPSEKDQKRRAACRNFKF